MYAILWRASVALSDCVLKQTKINICWGLWAVLYGPHTTVYAEDLSSKLNPETVHDVVVLNLNQQNITATDAPFISNNIQNSQPNLSEAFEYSTEDDATQTLAALVLEQEQNPFAENKALMDALQQRINQATKQSHESVQEEKVTVLEHTLFQNEKFRVYQHSEYNLDQATQKLKSGALEQLRMGDLTLSVGYGMAYQLDALHIIGYEYVSSFPHDRGQSIQLFWTRLF